ncbi:MAG: hypothetical protein MHPSP_002799, partial [Paramarteilia canceri]
KILTDYGTLTYQDLFNHSLFDFSEKKDRGWMGFVLQLLVPEREKIEILFIPEKSGKYAETVLKIKIYSFS